LGFWFWVQGLFCEKFKYVKSNEEHKHSILLGSYFIWIMRNPKTLDVFNIGMKISRDVYKIVRELPSFERYGLWSQLTRAAISVPSNIAEGCSRETDKEMKRFLEISLGSLFELETQLLIVNEEYEIDTKFLIRDVSRLQVKVSAFIKRIKERS